MSDDPRVTVPADEWDEGMQKSLDSAMPGWRSSIDHGGRGWEATANGWRCTECHHEVVGPVDVDIDAAHVCAPVPVSDEAEAWEERIRDDFQAHPGSWRPDPENWFREGWLAGFRAARGKAE